MRPERAVHRSRPSSSSRPLAIAPVLELTGTSIINSSIRYSSPRGGGSPLWLMWAASALSVLYFGVLEGRWGRSLGKH